MSPIEEIKEKLDIVSFIKGYLELKPAGKNFKALCPFHSEKTPSFIVSPERQSWHCFGCGRGGDIFGFLMAYENLEFYEALKVLAEKAGVELRQISPADQRQFGVLYDINAVAVNFFRDNLENSDRARQYLTDRKLKTETMAEFELGFAPNQFDSLTVYLVNNGYAVEDIVRSGLIVKTERGKYIDRFRGRIMFPIHNHFGKVVGFSGRSLPELESPEFGKYINSPETAIFNKSRLLYGFWKSKGPIREANTVLLVEGQMDFLMTWQDGVKNVAASSGTALTADHLKVLRKIADRLLIGFDGDEAGHLATERAIDLANAADFNVAVVSWGKFKDPGEAAAEEPGFTGQAVASAEPAMEYYLDRYLKGTNTLNRKKHIQLLLQKVRGIASKIEQSDWLKELSHRTGIREEQLMEEMARLPEDSSGISPDRFAAAPGADESMLKPSSRRELLAQRVLSLIYMRKELAKELGPYKEFMPPEYVLIYEHNLKGQPFPTAEAENIATLINMRSSFELEMLGEEGVTYEFDKLLRELKLEYLKESLAEIGREIAVAEAAGQVAERDKKLKLFDELSHKMQDIKNGKAD
ncbi:DNA primase [Patescibacteria group bacterium]|nr:DNA primase [Patescibacteria group bacterium]